MDLNHCYAQSFCWFFPDFGIIDDHRGISLVTLAAVMDRMGTSSIGDNR